MSDTVVCDRCLNFFQDGHSWSRAKAQSGGWYISSQNNTVLCPSCAKSPWRMMKLAEQTRYWLRRRTRNAERDSEYLRSVDESS